MKDIHCRRVVNTWLRWRGH